MDSASAITWVDVFTVILLGLQTAGAFAAVYFAWKAYRQTQEISKQQSEQTAQIHREQVQLAERNAYVAVFEQLKELQSIDPFVEDWTEATKCANLLEFIAVAGARGIVERKLLFALYGGIYIAIYEQIRDATHHETGVRGQDQILVYTPTATKLYTRWKKRFERLEQEALSLLTVKNEQEKPNGSRTEAKNGQTGRATR